MSFDPALSRLYFCDARPAFEGLACFTHNPDTGGISIKGEVAILHILSVITALPHYVSRVEGYSPTSQRTYLNDNFGALLSSEVVH